MSASIGLGLLCAILSIREVRHILIAGRNGIRHAADFLIIEA
jgi:hypothetical protein